MLCLSSKTKAFQKGLCCPADGLMQPWCNKYFALPFADVIIITAYLYLFCSAFAEQQVSAMLETVPMHTRGAAGKVTLPRFMPTYCHMSPKPWHRGCFRAICRAAPALSTQGKDPASCCPSDGPAAYYSCPRVPQGASGASLSVGGTARAHVQQSS